MPKTKNYKGTRSQPRSLYLVALGLFSLSTYVCLSREFKFDIFENAGFSFKSEPPINWVRRPDAMAKCQKVKKPILYVFFSKGTTESNRLRYDTLNIPDVYNYINANFLPVMVPLGSKHEFTDLEKTPEFKGISAQIGAFNSYPYNGGLCVVPYKMKNAKAEDIRSNANLAELGYLSDEDVTPYGGYNVGRMYGMNNDYSSDGYWRVKTSPELTRYKNKDEFMEYLYNARRWHTLPPTRGKVKWASAKVLERNKKEFQDKPRVLVMLDTVGQYSDRFRLGTLYNKETVRLLNNEFTPVLLEYDESETSAASKKVDALKAKYGVASLPAVVAIDTASGVPEVQRGDAGEQAMQDFLRVSKSTTLKPEKKIELQSGQIR